MDDKLDNKINNIKPKYLFHGTSNGDIKEFEPRKITIPGGENKNEVEERVYAGDNPGFCCAFAFKWATNEGFELSILGDGKVFFKVPKNEKHRLEVPVFLYKINSDNFTKTNGEGTGHSYHSLVGVRPENFQKFDNVEIAIKYFGGIIEYFVPKIDLEKTEIIKKVEEIIS